MKPAVVMAAGLVLAVAAGWAGGTARGEEAGPDPTKGRRIYEKLCQGCHGPGGRGDGYRMLGREPADLTAPPVTRRPEAALIESIHAGKPNMPAWRSRLSAEDARDVLAYIRSLPRAPAPGR